MRSEVARAAMLGGGVALAAVLLLTTGLLVYRGVQDRGRPATEMLVMAVAPGAEGGEVAAVAFVANSVTGKVRLLDTLAEESIAGSSARNARDAFTFGGGAAAAGALSAQTGGADLEWVVLPADLWSDLVDASGGVTVTVPDGLSAYDNGTLTVLSPGQQRLSGAQAVALASSADYFKGSSTAAKVYKSIGHAIAAAVIADPAAVGASVASGAAESSIDGARVFGSSGP